MSCASLWTRLTLTSARARTPSECRTSNSRKSICTSIFPPARFRKTGRVRAPRAPSPTPWSRTGTSPPRTPSVIRQRRRSTAQNRREWAPSSNQRSSPHKPNGPLRVNLENTWVQFGIHVFVGTMAGGLSDTVAVWMLFNPKRKRFGIQGAIPKNQARLARSLGRTVGERRLTPGDLQKELARRELLTAFQSRLEDVIAGILTSREPLIDKVPPAVVTALEGAMTSYLPVAMTKLGSFLGQPTTRVKLRTAL